MDAGDRGQEAAGQFLQAALAGIRAGQNQGASRMFCEDCGEPIPEKRRLAVPGCARCVFCQQKVERHGD